MSAEGDDVPPGFIIEDEEIIADFIVEAGEFLQQLDQDLIALEQAPEDLELLNGIFRAAHTIKGNASFLGFAKLTRFTHQTENVLDKLRSGEMSMNPEIMDLILASVDVMKALMDNLRDESQVDIEPTLQRLEKCLKGELSAPVIEVKVADVISAADFGDEMDEIIEDFKVEAGELIESLDQDLLSLEQTPDNLDLLNQIFRPVHTIKGNSSFLGFDKLTRFTHQLENLLDQLRSGDKQATPDIIDVILTSVDLMKTLMQNLQNEAAIDTEPMIAKIQACLNGESDSAVVAPVVRVAPPPEKKNEAPKPEPSPVAAAAPVESPSPRVETAVPTPAKAKPSAAPAAKKKDPEEATIRVDVERLDALMNLAGELVIAKNRLQQFTSLFEERFSENELTESLMLTTSVINFITGQFQEAVMKTRMLPIRKVFSRVPRMVRDLARDTRKQVNLIMEGEDTELDKSVIEHIGDPLVHIIRNAVDHGLETPEERRKSGKSPEGTVFLSAYSEGNYIVIEIKDDGKGMDPHKIFKKAVEKGLASPEDSLRLSEIEMLDFIFAPGFSTAETISNISGRGVGMNVVKENIMKLDGLVEIDSRVGEGSTFRIQLPLTMAIVPALLVKLRDYTYAIPLNNVVETLVVQPSEIYSIDQKQVLHLRDRFVSLVPLSQILSLPDTPDEGQKRYVIIVGVGEQRIGLLVDQLLGQEEVVIKTLGEFFDDVDLIAGATIMGDGSVVLILDIGHILQRLSRKTLYVS
ncbi:MAG: chemotaxis protein CheA [Candidatus Sericytochromatia bacterium]